MKLGIIGTGMIVKDFLTFAPMLQGLELTAVLGRAGNEQSMESLKEEYGIQNSYVDYDELLKSEVDTVYIALPNNLHFEFSKRALEAGKHVIVEKPMTSTYNQALILSKIAKERNLFIFEAITNQYNPNYMKIKKLLPDLGDIKIVHCNYSQYSSRYDLLKLGKILPAFSTEHSGGALMDINIYNIHYVIGLFGKPVNIVYYPNIEKGIDTSGILILEYDQFKCVCIGAKDCKAPASISIQGNRGCIYQNTPPNICGGFEFLMNDGSRTLINLNEYDHRMQSEFVQFVKMIEENDYERCYQMLEHSLIVSEVQTKARNMSGIVFPEDHE